MSRFQFIRSFESARQQSRYTLSLVCTLFLLTPLALHASEPVFPKQPPQERDSFLALQVKSALSADPELDGLNLVVSVADRVAVVGGPVPREALISQVRSTVSAVPGVTLVKVNCWVQAPNDPLSDAVARKLGSDAQQSAPDLPPPNLIAAGRMTKPPLALETPGGLSPSTSSRRPDLISQDEAENRMAAKFSMDSTAKPSPTAGFLLDPIAGGGERGSSSGSGPRSYATNAPKPTYPTIPPQSVPTQPAQVRVDPVSRLKDTDPRFSGLTVRVSGKTAVISGRAAQANDAWDFADKLREIFRGKNVIVGYVR